MVDLTRLSLSTFSFAWIHTVFGYHLVKCRGHKLLQSSGSRVRHDCRLTTIEQEKYFERGDQQAALETNYIILQQRRQCL